MHEFSRLQFQMTLWMCNWIFPPRFVGPVFLQFLAQEMVAFPFFPCQTHGVPGLLHVLNLLTTFMFAWATPSCSSTPSCIFFPLTLKCFYHLFCLQLLFRASLLYSVFHSTDIITSKLTNFLFNNSRQCYLVLLDLLQVITYCCLAYVSVVTHHLPHTLASFVSIPVDRVTLVLLWNSVDPGTGYATEVWENLMNAFSLQFLKQPLLYRYAAKMLIQVDLIGLPCLLSLYMVNIVEPCLYLQNCWYHFPGFLLFALPLLSLYSFIDSLFFIKSYRPHKATHIAA